MMRQTIGDFPVGYHRIHPDVSINFQMNRWLTWMGAESTAALAEIRSVAPRIHDYTDFVREFLALAQRAAAEGHPRKDAYYTRAAEFFMVPGVPEKRPARQHFVRLMRECFGVRDADYHRVPYRDGMLPTYQFTPAGGGAQGVIVVHGGFDSYIEEWLPVLLAVRDAGYRVVAFDGPGQGGALEEYGLPMTERWEEPIAAVLDHFGLDDVTLLGLSLGGGLAIRAAAFEPRVRRVIADDVLTDFLAVTLRQVHPTTRALVPWLLTLRAAPVLDALAHRAMHASLVAEWGVRQGMHVLGVRAPAAYFRTLRRYTTLPVSHLVRQDVLLMAGSEDHYVPRAQFTRQIAALTGARSVTGRLFTREEQAQNHCQVGNVGRSLRVMVDWIEQASRERSV